MSTPAGISSRDRDAILQSLRSGVVPRRGLQHVQVGRAREVEAMIADADRIAQGSATIRFIIGDYGAGKTFFLHVVRSIALKKRLVTAHADLDPDRRLHSSQGHARSLYAELMRNVATATKPDGGAVASVVERFVTEAMQEATTTGVPVSTLLQQRLEKLTELTGGYDFASVVDAYWRGHDTGNERLQSDAVRWLRGEFTTRSDAKAALGVRTIVDDATFYDHLKLFARFTVLAGYSGFYVCLDEMVNLYKLASTRARTSNYEQVLRILNDCHQGQTSHVGFMMCGTPELLTDTRRGLYSYEALQSRLAENSFAGAGMSDLSGPVLRLASLTPEDLFILLRNLRHVQAGGDAAKHAVPDEALQAFMEHCSQRLGEAYFRTPRTTIKAFLDLLAVLEQNPTASWRDVLTGMPLAAERGPDMGPITDGEGDDELSNFTL